MQTDNAHFLTQELARAFGQMVRSGSRSRSFMGLRQSEFMLLNTVHYYAGPGSKGMKISDLSKALQMTPAGATHLVNALEEGGYVERISDSEDRRVVLVRVTAKGEQQIQASEQHFFESFHGLVDHLGEEESQELLRLLQRTIAYFNEKK